MHYIVDSSVVIGNMILESVNQNNFSIPIKDNQLLIPSSDDRNNFIHRLTRYLNRCSLSGYSRYRGRLCYVLI